jgi:hypothetical protein
MPGNLQMENYCFRPPSIVVSLTTTPTLSLSLSLSKSHFHFIFISVSPLLILHISLIALHLIYVEISSHDEQTPGVVINNCN